MKITYREEWHEPPPAWFAWLLAIAYVLGAFTMFLACMFYR